MARVTLSYTDDSDRAYGAAGMAVGLFIYDGEERLVAVDIDANPSEMMEMTQEFHFSGNPSLSAKVVFNEMVRNFNYMAAMTVANALSRTVVYRHRELSPEELAFIRSEVVEEGMETCSLAREEAASLLDRCYDNLYRIFHNAQIHSVTHNMVSDLTRRRRLTRGDVLEFLRPLM